MARLTEQQPPAVAGSPTQGGDIRARWAWVEPTVWTERMLTALETGVKGGKWFSLIDKVWHEKVLKTAWKRVKDNAGSHGVDGITVQRFEARLEDELRRLNEQLRTGRYRPLPVRRKWILKPGRREKRPLGIPKADHQRWPNAYFRAHGLFSLAAAHAAECQSRSSC
jgi:RNA-directed DNA polymerase